MNLFYCSNCGTNVVNAPDTWSPSQGFAYCCADCMDAETDWRCALKGFVFPVVEIEQC